MSLISSSAASDATVSQEQIPVIKSEPGRVAWSSYVVIAILLMIVAGLGLRLHGLGKVGFAEDEINKLFAVRAYNQGDFSANAEHPMLMKVLIDLSLRGAALLNSRTGAAINEEAALRFPNALFGALTVVPLFLLTAALFNTRTGLWAAAFWAFGINAITYNRIGKEDTLMVFFLLFGFYFFIRAKQIDTRSKGRVRNHVYLSAISFGLMIASKYFPHYLGLNMLYHHKHRQRERNPGEPRFATPLSFFILVGVVFLIANPGLFLPSVWTHLSAYSAEKLLSHTGYIMGDKVFPNRMSHSPFWGLPLYFYLLLIAIKTPLAVLGTFLLGLVRAVKQWPKPGPRFILFMTVLWIVPYSLIGAKWARYTLSFMPFVYMGAAVGALILVDWVRGRFAKLTPEIWARGLAAFLVAIIVIVIPGWSAYAAAPHFGLFSNALGTKYTAYFFPHDEFYDDGVNEAIRFVCQRAPQNATIVTEVPGLVRYYAEGFGRKDLQSQVLSDPNYTPSDQAPTFVILQRGRTYFENQKEMKEVRERFTLVYAGCINGHTAAEVYAPSANSADAVQPCGDARP